MELRSLTHCISEVPEISKRALLLGNGFSIGCDAKFQYAELVDRAHFSGEFSALRDYFEQLPADFELVMEHLQNAALIASDQDCVQMRV